MDVSQTVVTAGVNWLIWPKGTSHATGNIHIVELGNEIDNYEAPNAMLLNVRLCWSEVLPFDIDNYKFKGRLFQWIPGTHKRAGAKKRWRIYGIRMTECTTFSLFQVNSIWWNIHVRHSTVIRSLFNATLVLIFWGWFCSVNCKIKFTFGSYFFN